MKITASRCLKSLVEKVVQLNAEANQKRQQEQLYQRLRELERPLRKREIEVT